MHTLSVNVSYASYQCIYNKYLIDRVQIKCKPVWADFPLGGGGDGGVTAEETAAKKFFQPIEQGVLFYLNFIT